MRNEENYNVLLLTIILASSTVFAKEAEDEITIKEEKPACKAILLGDDKGKDILFRKY